jgi:hypothetical protein
MRLIFLLLMKLERMRRRLLGTKSPHWFKDVTSLLGYIDVVTFGLTIFAIATAPIHFFRRLPSKQHQRSCASDLEMNVANRMKSCWLRSAFDLL